MIVDILSGTPVWVYLLLAFLLWTGQRALCTRTVPLRRIVGVPTIFVVWGLFGLASRADAAGYAPWLAAAAVGLVLGLARRIAWPIDHARGLVTRPASVLPLLRNVSLFAVHYALHVAAAIAPGRHDFMRFDMAVSGLCAGYFFGWLARFAQHTRRSANAGSTIDDPIATNAGRATG